MSVRGISVSTRAKMAALARQAAALPGDRAAARGRGAITGMVRGAHGIPLTGACVTAHGPAGTFHAVTHSNGRFLMSGVMPGHYTLEYSGCGSAARYATQWYDGASSKSGATVISVPVEKITGGIDATLSPAG